SLTSQVGGHTNAVLTTEDNILLIKQALPVELQFYRTVAASRDPKVDALRPYIPKFLGTLTLEGELDPDQPATDTSLPLKPNLAHPFTKPNILDIKLGTVLYDETASPEKVARMINTAENTTSLKTGMRLTGFQVYDNASGEPVFTPKTYGKSISKEQLPEGFGRFFPIVGAGESGASKTQGLPAPLLLQILELLREDIGDIRDAFAEVELRMVGGSLLILYESDAALAEEGLKWMLRDEDEDEDSEDEDDDDTKPRKPGPAYDVRFIDFAHTRFAPGQGPDEGVLLGLGTILEQLDRRIKTVGSSL
ncbi:hypothetical protein C8F01DRAFT_1326590, partial [Mycena amicta]